MAETGRTIEIETHAKVNLIHRVCDKRPDGYYNVISLLQSIDLADRLHFEVVEPERAGLSVVAGDVPQDERNLVLKALNILKKKFPEKVPPLSIRLEKRIPSGAGLGGGSGNAAGTLAALNRWLSLGLSDGELERLGASLGSDVPFFIRGGTQIGTGRGDQLSPVNELGRLSLVIAKPDFSISTAEAYGCFDRRPAQARLSARELASRLSALQRKDWRDGLENSFEQVLSERYSYINDLKERLMAQGCLAAMLCGSGAAVFGIADNRDKANKISDVLKTNVRWIQAVETCSAGWMIC